MPYFTNNQTVDIDASLHISVDDFLTECSASDITELTKTIKGDKRLISEVIKTKGRGYDAMEFEEAIKKLIANYYQLTKSETDAIITLSKRF